MATPRTDCGFVFIPLTEQLAAVRETALKNLTLACKYDLKVSKCVGATFSPDEGGWFSVEWWHSEHPWKYDEEIERALKRDYPFREVSATEFPRYDFRGDE